MRRFLSILFLLLIVSSTIGSCLKWENAVSELISLDDKKEEKKTSGKEYIEYFPPGANDLLTLQSKLIHNPSCGFAPNCSPHLEYNSPPPDSL